MSSTPAATDDRTTEARIRDAAIECIAEKGLDGFTARAVAEEADVSPGLVIHHFGSMDALREACDEHIVSVIDAFKREQVSKDHVDILDAIQGGPVESLAGYLAAVLADDSPTLARLVDQLVADAEGYMQQGVENGILKPTADPRSRAAVLTMWSLGALVMHRHVDRIFGVDPTQIDAETDPAKVAAYAAPGFEILHRGIYTDEFATRTLESLDQISAE
jgi:AcrR family transcriptional regulator